MRLFHRFEFRFPDLGFFAQVLPLLGLAAGVGSMCQEARADERAGRWEWEAGVLSTDNMELRGFGQGNATSGWTKASPALRMEYWSVKDGDWNYGIVFQPIIVGYNGTFKSDFSAKGVSFLAGQAGSLDYQFSTLKFSANKPVYQGTDGSSLRVGASAVARYAEVRMSNGAQSFRETNLILLPVLNIDAFRPLKDGYGVFLRADILPGVNGDFFLDGLYDVCFGVRRHLSERRRLDFGIRMIFGGYDPERPGDFANRIRLNALVLRYSY